MLQEFLSALALDMMLVLSKEEDFFSLKEDKRSDVLKTAQIPEQVKVYMAKVSEKEFLSDLAVFVNIIEGGDRRNVKCGIISAVSDFFNETLSSLIDHLDGAYYLLDSDGKQEIVDSVIKKTGHSSKYLKRLLITSTYQDLVRAINDFSAIVNDESFVLIQSPREISSELKKEIRTKIQKENPNTLPIFQTNKKLIGGLRVFVNGGVEDHSWLSRVLKFTSITN